MTSNLDCSSSSEPPLDSFSDLEIQLCLDANQALCNAPGDNRSISAEQIGPKSDSRPCTVCKAVHLSCDRMRPCSRCVRLGKEDECCDPPSNKRGRRALGSTQSKMSSKPRNSSENRCVKRPALTSGSKLSEQQLIAYTDGLSLVGCLPDFAHFLGYSQIELLGMPCSIMHPPELRDIYQQFFVSYSLSFPLSIFEMRQSGQAVFMTKAGRRLLCAFNGHLYLKSGAPTMGIITITDIIRDDIEFGFFPPPPFGESWNQSPQPTTATGQKPTNPMRSCLTSSISKSSSLNRSSSLFQSIDTPVEMSSLPAPDSDFWLFHPNC